MKEKTKQQNAKLQSDEKRGNRDQAKQAGKNAGKGNGNEAKQRKPQKASLKHASIDPERPKLSKAPKSASNLKSGKDKPAPRKDADATLRIIPLGGLDAIGKNMTVFDCKGDILIDDAGCMFPDDGHPGIDLILPDYTYLLQNAERIKGIIISHGHEDHTGCLPYLLKDLDLDIPIYSTKLTLGLIEGKLAEHRIKNAKLIEIKPGEQRRIGCFDVDFFSVNHSIPGAVGFFIQSPAGNVLHTGDFKIDQTPIDGVTTDFAALQRFSEIGVDVMMSDSTNAQKTSFTPSERVVGSALNDIISRASGKVVVACFASHLHRMQQICDAAVANGRKVVVTGRSMVQNTDIARRLGYLHIDDDDLIDAYHYSSLPPEQVVVMCTGSQGEPLSALARISTGGHKSIDIDSGDTVIISATPVPGNEKAVTRVMNQLAKLGCDVYDKNRALVHVSGHASSEELKLVLSIAKPTYFIPVHGEAMHLQAHARLAQAVGVKQENVFIMENGDTLALTAAGAALGEPVECGVVYVDGLSVGDTTRDILDERIALGSQGFACVAAAVSRKKHMVYGEVQLEMRGITGGDDELLRYDAARTLAGSIQRALAKESDMPALRKAARDALLSVLWERIKQRPMVVVSLIEV